MDKVIESLLKMRTPLTISGLGVVVFYLLYEQVLKLNIFTSLSESSTAYIISKILDGVLFFGLMALIIGVGAYVYLSIQNRYTKSNVTLVDASLDPGSKKYSEKKHCKYKEIRPNGQND